MNLCIHTYICIFDLMYEDAFERKRRYVLSKLMCECVSSRVCVCVYLLGSV